MAEPSIAMIPSGYKAEKIYSVLPTNGNADLDFARNSKATRINEQGLIEEMAVNVPLLDYSDGTCPSLLLQPQSTNLHLLSNDFFDWGNKTNLTVTSNYGISPDGTSNSNRLLFTGSGFTFNTGSNQVDSTEYTISAYVKRNNTGAESVGFFANGSGGVNHAFNLTTEWQRIEYTYTSTNTSTVGIAGVAGADISVFGFQLEESSFATSYIKTEGSTQTRLQDTASKSGLENEINSEEGTFYFEGSALANGGTLRYITASDNTWNNRLFLRYDANLVLTFRYYIGGSLIVNLTHTLSDSTTTSKIACIWKLNEFKLFVNGVKVNEDLSATVMSSDLISKLSFDDGLGSNIFQGNCKDLRIYKTALTDAQLTTLTTI